jgi:hypothetical protein
VAQALEAAGHTVIVADPKYAPTYGEVRRRSRQIGRMSRPWRKPIGEAGTGRCIGPRRRNAAAAGAADYNPGGRLPYTVYQAVADRPPMGEYDITKGFTCMYFEGEPDWVFGHGSSCTAFQVRQTEDRRCSDEGTP